MSDPIQEVDQEVLGYCLEWKNTEPVNWRLGQTKPWVVINTAPHNGILTMLIKESTWDAVRASQVPDVIHTINEPFVTPQIYPPIDDIAPDDYFYREENVIRAGEDA